jgi:16S rRNA (cytidine1402-2'-O)-methyltransferase
VRDSLADICETFGGDRPAFVGRELTKMHEQCAQGPLAGLLRQLDEGDIPCKGEFVIIVSGSEAPAGSEFNTDVLLLELAQHLPPKTVAKIVARVAATSRNDMYRRLLQLTGRSPEETD